MLMDFGSKLPSGPSLEHNSYIREYDLPLAQAAQPNCSQKILVTQAK